MTTKAEYSNIWTQGWKVGFDTKNMLFSEGGFTGFRELINCLIDAGGSIVPRPPVATAGRVSGQSDGLLYYSGALYSFVPAGTIIPDSSPAKPLFFDIPEQCSRSYEVVEHGVFQNAPYALIKHTRVSQFGFIPTRVTSLLKLHVWDNKVGHPTYVQDPFAPADWSGGAYPTYSYGIGTPGAWTDHTPVSAESASRVFISRTDADIGFCGIGRLRTWNPYDAATIEKQGLGYYFMGDCASPSAGIRASIVIPEPYSYLTSADKYAGYIVEKLAPNGSWTKVAEDATMITAVTPDWINAGAVQATRVSVPGTTEEDLLRIRVCVTPEVSILTGCTLNPVAGTIVGAGSVLFEGTTYTSTALVTPLAASATLYVGVKITISGSTITAAGFSVSTTDVTPSGITRYGTNRYLTFILATITTDGAGNLLTTTNFLYPNIKNDAWYTQKHNDNINYWAGIGETGALLTSTKEPQGNRVTALQAVKNRMCVCFPQSTQLWDIGAAASQNAFIDRYDFGTTDQTTLFYNRPVICTERGIRAFDLTGLNYQSLEDLNIGERVQALGRIKVKACSFWPWYGSYVAFCELSQTDRYAFDAKLPADSPLQGSSVKYGFLILSYSKEAELAAWSWNPVEGLTTLYRKMAAVGDRLYFRSGDIVYFLNANSIGDNTDSVTGGVFVQRALTQYSHVGKPGAVKRTLFVSKSGPGKMRARPLMAPYVVPPAMPDNVPFPGHLVSGETSSKRKIPFTNTGTALSVEMRSIDAAGMVVDSLSVDYKTLGK